MANDRWRHLCEAIIVETDTQKLLSLVNQLEEELDLRDPKTRHVSFGGQVQQHLE